MRHIQYDKDPRPASRRILTYTAREADEGRPIRDIILFKWKLVAHDVARAKYETPDGITVNGEVSWVNRKMHAGDILKVVITDRAPERIIPTEGPLDIVYEDEDLICVSKPAGIVVHPSHGHYSDSLANRLAWYFESRNEPHEIRTVGRLDKDTSGLLLFGKSRSAVGILDAQTESGTRTKVYMALCEGTFAAPDGCVDIPIGREFDGNIKRIAREGGDEAHTCYHVEAQYDGYALVRLTLGTGRTHQIRVHMSHIGHPLLGDPLYGRGPYVCPGRSEVRIERTALHAAEIAFAQPFAGNRITLRSDLPEDMASFL